MGGAVEDEREAREGETFQLLKMVAPPMAAATPHRMGGRSARRPRRALQVLLDYLVICLQLQLFKSKRAIFGLLGLPNYSPPARSTTVRPLIIHNFTRYSNSLRWTTRAGGSGGEEPGVEPNDSGEDVESDHSMNDGALVVDDGVSVHSDALEGAFLEMEGEDGDPGACGSGDVPPPVAGEAAERPPPLPPPAEPPPAAVPVVFDIAIQPPQAGARNPAAIALNIGGKGVLRYYDTKRQIVAMCTAPELDHKGCFKTKSTMASPSTARVGQGRPLGILLAWLLFPSDMAKASRDAHVHCEDPSFDLRKRCRDEFVRQAAGIPLARLMLEREAPSASFEDEPERVP